MPICLRKIQEVHQSLMNALETSDTKFRDDLSELVRDIDFASSEVERRGSGFKSS